MVTASTVAYCAYCVCQSFGLSVTNVVPIEFNVCFEVILDAIIVFPLLLFSVSAIQHTTDESLK